MEARDNTRAQEQLGWRPVHDFASLLARLRDGDDARSPLARMIGSKGCHDRTVGAEPYPVDT